MWGANVARIGETNYTSFENALSAATAGQTIVLLTNIGTKSSEAVTISKNVTIDGQGQYSISRYFTVNASKQLTLKDITVSNNKKASSAPRTVTLKNGSHLILSNATIVPNQSHIAVGVSASASAYIDIVEGTTNTIRNYTGNTTIYLSSTSSFYALYIQGNGTLNVEHVGTGGFALGCVQATSSAKFVVTAPNFNVTSEAAGRVFSSYLTTSNLTCGIYSDKPAADLVNDQSLIFPMTGENAGKYEVIGTINVATYGVKASIDKLAYTSLAAAIAAAEVGDEVTLWDDAVATAVTKSIYIYPNGHDASAITAGTGYIRVTKKDWQNNDYYFFGAVNSTIEGGKTVYLPTNSSELAFAASLATNGEIIRLANDITLNEKIEFVGDIIFDLNGKTITCDEENYLSVQDEVVTFVDGSAGQTGTVTTSDYTCLYVTKRQATSKAIINGGTFISTKATYNGSNMEKATIQVGEGAELEINDGRIQSNNNAIYAKASYGWKYQYGFWMSDNTVVWPATVTINGGEIVSSGEECICMAGNSAQGGNPLPTTLTLNGGTITGTKHGVVLMGNGATLNMTDGTITATNGFGIAGNGKVGSGNANTVNDPNAWVDYGGTSITISGGSVTSANAAGIYQPQAGDVTIEGGAITGQTGIAIKSGTLEVTGGTITATGEQVVYEHGYNGGALQTGAAISIESNGVYAGGINISISDDANLVSAEGYAIYEYVSNPGDDTQVENISVIDGNFEGGVSVSQDLAAEGGFISGGTWSEDVIANVVEGKTTTETSGDYVVGLVTVATSLIPATINANSIVELANSENLVDNKEVKKLTVENVTLTVKSGKILKVGKGAVLLQGTGKIIVEAGGSLLVDGLVYGADGTNFEIQTSETQVGSVLFSPATHFITEDHPAAVVAMTVAQGVTTGGEDVWTRFAMPVDELKTAWTKTPSVPTWLYGWDYETSHWALLENGSTDMQPWNGYTLSNDQTGAVVYTFHGNLVGNADAALNFVHEGYQYFGNSYTAYIDAKTLLQGLIDSHIDGSIWMWDVVNQVYGASTLNNLANKPEILDDWQKEVAPMQTFILKISGASSADESISYADAIWGNPRYGNSSTASPAPRRQVAAQNEEAYMQIEVTAANGKKDRIVFTESTDYSDAFESGYDASKYMNERALNIFSTISGENYSVIASDNIGGKTMSLRTVDAATYTMTFRHVEGEGYAVRDNVTGSVIAVEEDATYEFAAQPNSIAEGRFEIISPAKTPTAIDNTDVKSGVKGIYTIMGQYLGEDFNALPAGVYIVNGVKIVK